MQLLQKQESFFIFDIPLKIIYKKNCFSNIFKDILRDFFIYYALVVMETLLHLIQYVISHVLK